MDTAQSIFGRLLDTHGNEFTTPDFTMKQIRDAIPKHCFERSALRGYYYIIRDLVYLATTFYIFHNYVTPECIPFTPARTALWGLYTVLQGLFGTGIWVIAHECGHGAFSSSHLINDVTGWFLHSALLVPYFSWQISHRKHHQATNNMERDMVFVPKTREEEANRIGRMAHELDELAEDAPLFTLIALITQQLVGWPNYLITNVTGQNYLEHDQCGDRRLENKNSNGRCVNHFNPSSPLFTAKDTKLILISDIGIALTFVILASLIYTHGWSNMAVWYFIPYLWVNHWLVAITFIQHNDPSLPHYTSEEWTFVRGAAATIDRNIGFIGRYFMHGVTETHVLHHFVSTIPFYHAYEASEAIRPIMGKHYKSDTEKGIFGFFRAIYRCARMCQWVESSQDAKGPGKSILFFRNRNRLGTKPLSMKVK